MPRRLPTSRSSSSGPTRSSSSSTRAGFPSGDSIAAELTRFLREREQEARRPAPGGVAACRRPFGRLGRLPRRSAPPRWARRDRGLLSATRLSLAVSSGDGFPEGAAAVSPAGRGAAAFLPPAPRLASRCLGRGEVLGEGVGDLVDRAELLACLVEQVVRARRVPLGRCEQRDADLEWQRRGRPGRAARRSPRAGGRESWQRHRAAVSPPDTPGSPGGPASCASHVRDARSSGRGSARARWPFPLRPRGAGSAHPAARSFSHGGACVTSVTRSSKSARSTGVATRSASAVMRSRRFGFSAAQMERNVSSATLLARPSVNFFANSARWSKRMLRPAIVAQNRCSSSSRYFGSIRCHSRWITASRRATSGVTGTSHGAGESLRRARRCWRRRGAGVTRAPSR